MIGRLRSRLRPAREEGIALVLAVLVLAIVSIMAASAIAYTDGSQRDAFSRKSGQTAYSLAQAALSNANAQLTSLFYDNSGQPFDNSTSLATMAQTWSAKVGGSQRSPDDTSACATTSPISTCMTWTAVLNCPTGVSCPGETGTIVPSSAYEKARWHVTATGTVPNPSGTTLISRTITVDVPVLQTPAAAPAPAIFKTVYSGAVSNGCDLTTGQNVVWGAPVYVKGNLCVGQGSGVEQGPSNLGSLTVGGWLELSGNGAHVGTSSKPVSSLSVGGVCTTSSTVPPASGQACANTLTKQSGYWTDSAGTIFVSAATSNPSFPTPPTMDWSPIGTSPSFAWNAGSWSCTGGRSLTAPPPSNFILNGTSYECSISTGGVQTGYLKWDGTTLTVKGNVWITGNVTTSSSNPQFVYSGLGTIYAGGTVSFANNTTICVGQTDSTGNDCPNGASWNDIADNFLLIASQGDMSGGTSNSNLNLEGGLYSQGNINFGSGHTHIYGPIVTPQSINPGQQAAAGFPNIVDLFTGAPGSPQSFWTLGTPTNGTY